MPQNPPPDGGLVPGVTLTAGNLDGPLQGTLPAIRTRPLPPPALYQQRYEYEATADLLLTFPQIQWDALEITIEGPVGADIEAEIHAVYGRFPNRHADFVSWFGLTPCPVDATQHRLWVGGQNMGHIAGADTDPNHRMFDGTGYYIPPRPPVIRLNPALRLTSFDLAAWPSTGQILSGPAQVAGLQLYLEVGSNARDLPGRALQITIRLNGQPIAQQTIIAVAPHEFTPEAPGAMQAAPYCGGAIDLFDGNFNWDCDLFEAHGPGLPVEMGLTYHAFTSAYWRAVAPAAGARKLAALSFGHGWSCLYGIRLMKHERDNTARPSGGPRTQSTSLHFHDANGRLVIFEPTSTPKVYAPSHRNFALSEAFGVSYSTLTATDTGNGFTLESAYSPLRARFDIEGRLTELRRRDHGRPLQIRYGGTQATIVDAQRRQTTWTLDTDGRVLTVEDPGKRVWSFVYDDDTLIKIAGPGTTYAFQYDPDSFQMTELLGPGFNASVTYLGSGPDNRLVSGTAARIVDGPYSTDISYVSRALLDCDITVSEPQGRQALHRIRDRYGTDVYWTTERGGALSVLSMPAVDATVSRLVAMGERVGERQGQPQVSYAWSLGGEIVETSYADSTRTQTLYGAGSNQTRVDRIVDQLGRAKQFEYIDTVNASDLVHRIVEPEPGPGVPRPTAEFDYTNDGDLLAITNPIGVVTEFKHSSAANEEGLAIESVTDPGGLDIRESWSYDEMGRVILHTGPEGEQTRTKYDDLGRVVERIEPDKTWTRFGFDPATGQLTRVWTSAGAVMELTVDQYGRVAREVDPEEGWAKYEHNEFGAVTREEQESGLVTLYQYDGAGRVEEIQETTPAGRATTRYVFDTADSILEERRIEPNTPDEVTTTTYDVLGRPTTTVGPEVMVGATPWRSTKYEQYTRTGLIERVRVEIAPGQFETITHEYDGLDRLIAIVKGDPSGQTAREEFEYDAAGNMTVHRGDNFTTLLAHTQPRPRRRTQRTVQRDTAGRETAISDTNGDTLVDVSRNQSGQITEVRLPDSQGQLVTVERRRYVDGLLVEVTDENSNPSKIDYDRDGRPNRIVDVYGNATEVEYTPAGQLQRSVSRGADGSITIVEYAYTPTGSLSEVAQIRGGVREATQFKRNAAGLVERMINPLSAETSFEYNANGLMTARVDPDNRRTEWRYDALGLLQEIRYPGGWIVRVTHDAAGRLTALEDPLFRVEIEHNVLGQPETYRTIEIATGAVRSVTANYDEYAMPVEIVDDTGFSMLRSYNSENHLIDIQIGGTTPPTPLVTFDRDRQGRVIRQTAGPIELAYEWNTTGHLQTAQASLNGQRTGRIEYAYDRIGRRVEARLPHLGLSTSWSYDGVGRLIEERVAAAGATRWLDRSAWDEAGNRIARIVNGLRFSYQFNAFNQLERIDGTEIVPIPPASLAPQADSEIDSAHRAALVVDNLAPADSGPGRALVTAATDQEHWLELGCGSPTRVDVIMLELPADHGLPSSLDVLWRDPANSQWQALPIVQVLGATPGAAGTSTIVPRHTTIQLLFTPVVADAFRVVQPQGAAPPQPAIAAHRLALAVSEIRLFTVRPLSIPQMYDRSGNLLQSGNREYSYDAEHRLVTARDPGVMNAEFVYGPDGCLLREINRLTGETVEHTWKDGVRHATVKRQAGTRVTSIIGDENDPQVGLVVRGAGAAAHGASRFFLNDAAGTVHQVISDTGAVAHHVTSAWGESIVDPLRPFESAEERYAGHTPFDGLSFYDFGARAYDARSARFLSPDPAGIPELPNRYSYALGDPVNLVDRDGRIVTHLFGGLASVAIGWGVSKLTGKAYTASDALIDFGVGFATSGLSSAAKCAKLGQAVYAMQQGGFAARAASRAAVTAAGTTLGVGGDYVQARLKGEEFNLASSLAVNTLGAFAGTFFTRAYCFASGTLVATDNGFVPIERITAGQVVLTRDSAGVRTAGRVIGTTRSEAAEIIAVTFGTPTQTVCCTPTHHWFVAGKGWVGANALRAGDSLTATTGDQIEVTAVERRANHTALWNLEIDEHHCFYVAQEPGATAVLVHNACPQEAERWFQGLTSWRQARGVAGSADHAFAVLVHERGRAFWSRNGWLAARAHGAWISRQFAKFTDFFRGASAASRRHAEGGAIQALMRGVRGRRPHPMARLTRGRAVLIVDKELCGAFCQNKAGVRRMAWRAGLDELFIITRESCKHGKAVDTIRHWTATYIRGPEFKKRAGTIAYRPGGSWVKATTVPPWVRALLKSADLTHPTTW